MTRRAAPWRALAGTVLVALALLGLIVSIGTIPHSHIGPGPGFYNQEHDLAILAGVGVAVATPEAPSVAPLLDVADALILAPALVSRPAHRGADSRAPPTA